MRCSWALLLSYVASATFPGAATKDERRNGGSAAVVEDAKFHNVLLRESSDPMLVDREPFLLEEEGEEGMSRIGLYYAATSSDSCAAETDCPSCTNHSKLCNWCAHDQACHSKGSMYGCLVGEKCSKHHDDDDSGSTCAQQTSCENCTSHSNWCHWCAHDQACHAKGSYYGCVVGAKCTDDDHHNHTDDNDDQPAPNDNDDDGTTNTTDDDTTNTDDDDTAPPNNNDDDTTPPNNDDDDDTTPNNSDDKPNTNDDTTPNNDDTTPNNDDKIPNDDDDHANDDTTNSTDDNTNHDDDHNHDEDDTIFHRCGSYTSCWECANSSLSSSHYCHWCAHDNACHPVTSGCDAGVECFVERSCQRTVPESIHHHSSTRITTTLTTTTVSSWGVEIIVAVVGLVVVGCATLCLCCVRSIHITYQNALLESETHRFIQNHTNIDEDVVAAAAAAAAAADSPDSLSTPLLSENEHHNHHANRTMRTKQALDPLNRASHVNRQDNATPRAINNGLGAIGDTAETSNAGRVVGPPNTTDCIEVIDLEEPTLPQHRDSTHTTPQFNHTSQLLHPPRSGGRRIRRLYQLCAIGYGVTLIGTVFLAVLSIRYYPRSPQLHLCNDEAAWNLVMDRMAAAAANTNRTTTTMEFEILASVSNKNLFDISIDSKGGGGNLSMVAVSTLPDTDNLLPSSWIGIFDLPPATTAAATTTVPARSVADVLLVARFASEPWNAWNVSEVYRQGQLSLFMDAAATVHIPQFRYLFTWNAKFQSANSLNESSDRTFCFCSSWNKKKNPTTSFLL